MSRVLAGPFLHTIWRPKVTGAEHVPASGGAILAEGYRGTGFDQLLVGSAATVVEGLRRYRAMGFDSVMVRHVVGDHQLMLRSFERIGRDVMPRIRAF